MPHRSAVEQASDPVYRRGVRVFRGLVVRPRADQLLVHPLERVEHLREVGAERLECAGERRRGVTHPAAHQLAVIPVQLRLLAADLPHGILYLHRSRCHLRSVNSSLASHRRTSCVYPLSGLPLAALITPAGEAAAPDPAPWARGGW